MTLDNNRALKWGTDKVAKGVGTKDNIYVAMGYANISVEAINNMFGKTPLTQTLDLWARIQKLPHQTVYLISI